ncbi:MAG: hypothetical protein KDD50_10760, partial [Bdellovibrionales bacterium]|nr:hypothetical protein [Bdellovibrionales bacterium]
GLTYDQYFNGDVGEAALDHYYLYMNWPSRLSSTVAHDAATRANEGDLYIFPQDAFNNNLSTKPSGSMTFSYSTSLLNSPNGDVPNIPTNGFYAFGPENASTDPVLKKSHLKLPFVMARSDQTITVTFTDNNGFQGTKTITSEDGPLNYIDLRDSSALDGNGAPTGRLYGDSDGEAMTITTDGWDPPYNTGPGNSLQLYVMGYDSFGNFKQLYPGDWQTAGTLMYPYDAIDMYPVASVQILDPIHPTTQPSQIRVDVVDGLSSASASINPINISYGKPAKVGVVFPATATAGVAQTLTARITDSDNNVISSFNENANVAFSTSGNAPTRTGYTASVPATGQYLFTNGEATWTNAVALYNAEKEPAIRVDVDDDATGSLGAFNISGGSYTITVATDALHHIAVYPMNSDTYAGTNETYVVRAEDQYSNLYDVNASVEYKITSALGGEDIVSSTLSGLNVEAGLNVGTSDLSGTTATTRDTHISGTLVNGYSEVVVNSSKAGILTVSSPNDGQPNPPDLNSLTVKANTTIASIGFKFALPSTMLTTIDVPTFTVEARDSFGNVIESNNSDIIDLVWTCQTGSCASQDVTGDVVGYSAQTLSGGDTDFNGLHYWTAETIRIRAELRSDPTKYVEQDVIFQEGSANKTIVIIDQQTHVEGKSSVTDAISGDPFGPGDTTAVAGDTFNVQVRVVDDAFNLKETFSGTTTLISPEDPHLEILSGSGSITGGIATFNVRVRRQHASYTFKATGTTAISEANNLTSTVITVNENNVTQLITVLEGQTLDEGALDLASALSGNPNTQTAGEAGGHNVTVYAVDDYYNIVPTATPTVDVITSDPNDTDPTNVTLVSGSKVVNILNYTAAGVPHYITASDDAYANALTDRVSENYTVNANTATQIIGYYPDGQTHNPGKTTYAAAITGTPNSKTTDDAISFRVLAVDNWFNIRQDYDSTHNADISTDNDPTDNETSYQNVSFSSGQASFAINPVTAATNQQTTISGADLPISNQPAKINITHGSAQQLVAIFNDCQTFNPGQTSSAAAVTTGSCTNRTAGTAFNIHLYATDSEFNIITTGTDSTRVVGITADPSSTGLHSNAEANKALSSGEATFSFTNYKLGSSYYVAPTNAYGWGNINTSNYNVDYESGRQLIVKLPNQTYLGGVQSLANAITGTPYKQTQSVSFDIEIIAVDTYFNKITGDSTSNVALTGFSNTNDCSGALTSGSRTCTVTHTSFGTTKNMSADDTSGTNYTPVSSSNYDVLGSITTPVLALEDVNTGLTTHIRATNSLKPILSNAGSYTGGEEYCFTTTSTRPAGAGSNSKSACTGQYANGANNGWYTSMPGTLTTSSGDGTKTVYIWIADSALNVSTSAVSDSIILDTALPAQPTITVTDQTSSETDASDTLTANVSITGDTDAVDWCIQYVNHGNSAPSTPALANSCWVGTRPTTYSFIGVGDYDVYLFTRDIAYNVSAVSAGQRFKIDSTAPAAFSITGLTGGGDSTADSWLGDTPTPTINWGAATESYTNVTYTVTIKTNADGDLNCGLGATTSATTSATSYTFTGCTLSDATSYKVYITAQNEAELSTNATNDGFAFTVDTTYPAAPDILGVSGGTDVITTDAYLTNNTNPVINWTDNTGEDSYSIEVRTHPGDV